MNLRKVIMNYDIRRLFVLVMIIACMSLTSNVLSAQPMEGEERVPLSAVDNLTFGNTQDLIVLFNDEAVLNQSEFLRGVYNVLEDTPEILAYKSSRYDEIKQGVLIALPSGDIEILSDYGHLPMMFLRFKSLNSLNQLLKSSDVVRVYEDQAYHHFLTQSLPLINQPQVAASGRIGTGTAVAILDTGVDYTRSAFGNCTSPGAPSTCKVIYAQDFAPSDGQRDVSPYHGTNVAGISLGVAPDTRIIALDVFSGSSAYSNHIINAINWCITNKSVYNIVAINMSLGGGRAYSPCSGDVFATPIANAKAAGILSSVASGNDAYKDSIASPACAPAAVSVGAVYDANLGAMNWSDCSDSTTAADKVTCFSNSASFLTILAPGSVINAAGISMSGTSQATPHIAGSIAVLKGAGAYPSETPDQIISRMTGTGVSITDWANGIIKPRIDLSAAAGSETAPTANFTATPTSGAAPLNVNFTDTSTGSPTSWSWNFGDSGTSTLQNPSHTYTNPGTYTVSLTATNAQDSDIETKTNYITVQAPTAPTANFTGSPTSGAAPLNVNFTDTSTGSPTSWSWNFGDSGTSTLQNPSHTYTNPGTYTVSLTATNAQGPDIETKTNYITVQVCAKPPYITFINPSSAKTGAVVDIYGRYFSTSPLVFFNGVQAQVTSAASYQIKARVPEGASSGPVRVEGPSGCISNQVSFTVIGSPSAPVANFTGSPTSGTAPLNVNFTDTSTGSPTSWSWNFGDSGTSTLQNPSHTYTNPGTYTVSLTATNAQDSDIETKTNYITVQAPTAPTANFTGSPTSGAAPLNVSFTDTSTGSPTSWSWNFGDSGTSTLQNPSHTYTNPGTYTVSLTATNAQDSDIETKTNYITVQACAKPPYITFINPSSAKTRAVVDIYGRYFSTSPLVFFNGVQAEVTSAASYQIKAKVPVGASTGPVRVEGPSGCISNQVSFTVLP